MKVLDKAEAPPSYVGLVGRCTECHTIMQLEAGDEPLVSFRDGEFKYFYKLCAGGCAWAVRFYLTEEENNAN